ncbi:hypothetical protein WDZ92_39565, partial [Nostoc sp. NIES-2111]
CRRTTRSLSAADGCWPAGRQSSSSWASCGEGVRALACRLALPKQAQPAATDPHVREEARAVWQARAAEARERGADRAGEAQPMPVHRR